MDVDVRLWEWDGNAFLVELEFYVFGDVETHGLVVTRIHPGATYEVDAAVRKFRNRNGDRRVGKNA